MNVDTHHRFALHNTQGELTLQIEATLGAPWTVLFGPSGSGKSTLLRALAGLLPAQGSFERCDPVHNTWIPLAQLPPEHRRLAYAPQHALLFPHLTAEQNLRFPGAIRGSSIDPSAISDLVALLQLSPLLPRYPRQLSGGERQRVALARALAVPDAQLLLLDEPFAGLDRALRDTLVPGLRRYLAARHLPVLSVTHDPDEVLLLQADVLRLQHGHLTGHGPARVVLADEIQRLRAALAPLPPA